MFLSLLDQCMMFWLSAPAMLNGDVIGAAQFEALQHAMKQLETKYTQTMRDKADLSDKNEQLEHLILQLEGETETIGQCTIIGISVISRWINSGSPQMNYFNRKTLVFRLVVR